MRKKTITLIVLFIILFVIASVVGRYQLSFSDIWQILTGNCDDEMKKSVFLNIRFTRNLFVAVAGASLALSGFVYQSIFRNPLASPDILGVSNGASVGAIIAILFLPFSGLYVQVFAFIAGVLVVVGALLLSKVMKGSRIFSMVIAGIIISALANSIIMFLKYTADPNRQLATIDYWLMGSFHSISWNDIFYVVPICIISGIVLFVCRYQLKVLTLSDEEARSLGINVGRLRCIAILCSTIMVSSIVAIVGVVAWIGLIVPHLVRMIFGENFDSNFVQSIFFGSSLLLAADMIARSISTSEIPISILTSLIGGVSLILFMSKKNRARV